jgi:hypothetical protein
MFYRMARHGRVLAKNQIRSAETRPIISRIPILFLPETSQRMKLAGPLKVELKEL